MNRKLEFIKKIFIILILHVILLGYLFVVPHEVFAADPTLITKLKGAFEKIEGYILKLATPVAAISIGVGALMKKFSFGDEERIRTGKRIIKGSLFSYAFILGIDLILSAIKSLIN